MMCRSSRRSFPLGQAVFEISDPKFSNRDAVLHETHLDQGTPLAAIGELPDGSVTTAESGSEGRSEG